MSKRPVVLLIEDIWEAIEKIERYTSGMPRKSLKNMGVASSFLSAPIKTGKK